MWIFLTFSEHNLKRGFIESETSFSDYPIFSSESKLNFTQVT